MRMLRDLDMCEQMGTVGEAVVMPGIGVLIMMIDKNYSTESLVPFPFSLPLVLDGIGNVQLVIRSEE